MRLAILIVVLGGSLSLADGAFASHFRYSHVTWDQTGTSSVDFTVSSSFRRCGYSGSAVDGCPAVGDVIFEGIGATALNFGDSTTTGVLSYRVTAINPSEDWLIGLGIDPAGSGSADTLIGHTYGGAGPFTAAIDSCCTIGGLNNNAGGGYRVGTLVDLASEDESSISSVPPIVTVGSTGVQTFPVPAIDSGGETLRWRLATPAEACSQSCGVTQPPGLTINQNTGVVSWDTTGQATGLWFVSVVIESLDGAGNVVSTSQVTFLINVVAGTNQPPDWDSPPTPAQASEFTVSAGSPLSISLQASDPDTGDTVHIDNLGLPPGATFTSTDGNPATATFNWTPTTSQTGDFLVTFTAQDNGTPQQSAEARTYVIHVVSGPGPPATLTLSPPTATNTAGQQHCVTATVEDASGNPTPGISVVFRVTGANNRGPATRTTNANGKATFCYTGTHAGTDTIRAFADTNTNGTDDGASEPNDTATKTYTAAAPSTLTLTPKTASNPVDSQHCVTATVKDEFGNPTSGITVRFRVTGSVTRSGSRTTNTSGKATFCYTGPALPGSDTIKAYADTNNSNTQNAGEPSDTATKTWTLPTNVTPCEILITEGGWITTNAGDRATFGGNAKETSTGADSGQQEYQDHGPAVRMDLHSINVQAITCNNAKTRASIFGKATIDGSGSYNYRIDVQDLGEPGGGVDTYRIRLSTGYDSGERKLGSGNIQIH